MKLYATSRSERAEKGQGGNKYLETIHNVEHDNGEREQVARTVVTIENDAYHVHHMQVQCDDVVTIVPIRKV